MKKLAILAAMAAAGPASANELDGDDTFFGYPGYFYSVVDEVEYENVRERNDRDGECFVEDIDLDGFITEYELICYY